jgi:5-methylcytosine-specific restriction endonuclease McrA
LGGALLLNASFEPLCVVPTRRAVVLVLKEKAEIICRQSGEMRSERASFPMPSVIRLLNFVRVPHRAAAPISRRAVFARDAHRCQYCARAAENLDHVLPRSRGGQHAWDNVVACCRSCNARKGDRLLHETDLVLTRPPRAPHVTIWIVAAVGSLDPAWEQFLPEVA